MTFNLLISVHHVNTPMWQQQSSFLPLLLLLVAGDSWIVSQQTAAAADARAASNYAVAVDGDVQGFPPLYHFWESTGFW